MIRPTVARVDLAAIESNLGEIQRFLSTPAPFGDGPRTTDVRRTTAAPRVIAVVKANAYGHGASEVGLALERAGAAMLACADIEEGVVLRRAGVQIPILVFGALGISDLDGVFEYNLTPTISTPTAAQNLAAAAAKGVRAGSDPTLTPLRPHSDPTLTPLRPHSGSSRRLRCHLKIDTGMNRLGFR